MVATGQLRYVLGLAATVLVALGGVLNITSTEYWGATGVVISITIADVIKHRND